MLPYISIFCLSNGSTAVVHPSHTLLVHPHDHSGWLSPWLLYFSGYFCTNSARTHAHIKDSFSKPWLTRDCSVLKWDYSWSPDYGLNPVEKMRWCSDSIANSHDADRDNIALWVLHNVRRLHHPVTPWYPVPVVVTKHFLHKGACSIHGILEATQHPGKAQAYTQVASRAEWLGQSNRRTVSHWLFLNQAWWCLAVRSGGHQVVANASMKHQPMSTTLPTSAYCFSICSIWGN